MANEGSGRERKLLRRDLLKGVASATTVGGAASPLVQAAQAERNGLPFIVSPGHAEVETTTGKVRGFTELGIFTYLGIPYGAPTGGAARFQPPRKPEAWTSIRDSLQYGPVCPQQDAFQSRSDINAFFHEREFGRMSEDCLRLNVWTPGINDNGKRPVLLWLHERGFFAGSGHEHKSLHGRNLAERGDVVVVTINHRLNAFGFLNLADYGEKYESSVNVGMLDIVAALEWVRDNVGAFGGEPGNVTIFGQSGGGAKVNHLLAMPSAKGLFHRAVAQSPISLITHRYTRDQAAKFADAVVRKLGLDRSTIERIHKVSQQQIVDAYDAAMGEDPDAWIGPAVDGKILPEAPFYAAAPAISAEIPLMVGTPMFDRVPLLTPEADSMTEAELVKNVTERFGARAERVLDVVGRTFPGEKPIFLWHQIRLILLRARDIAILQAARKAEQNAAPAYLYQFAWKTPVLDGRPQAFHGSEVAFVFCNTDRCARMTGGTAEARAVAANVSDAWIHFARTGNPNHPGIAEWPAFTPELEPTMIFDTECEVRNNYDREAREVLRAEEADEGGGRGQPGPRAEAEFGRSSVTGTQLTHYER